MLQADSDITDEISTRAYMGFAPQGTTKPFIAYRAELIQDTFTKDKTSTVDTYLAEIDISHNSIAEAEALGTKVYAYFQGYSGTTSGGATVKGCRLDREAPDVDEEGWQIWTQDFEIKVER